MNIASMIMSVLAQAAPPAAPATSSPIELDVWKWVVIIGVGAVVLLYAVKRIADVVTKKKTDNMIRQVVGKDAAGEGGDWDDLKEMNKDLDK